MLRLLTGLDGFKKAITILDAALAAIAANPAPSFTANVLAGINIQTH
jgi:hypothetical protein